MGAILMAVLAPIKNYIMVGAGVATVLVITFMAGEHSANEKHAQGELQQKVRDLNLGIAIDAADRVKLIEQQKNIDKLNKELASARTKIKDPDHVCFESGDVEQLLDVWPKPATPSR